MNPVIYNKDQIELLIRLISLLQPLTGKGEGKEKIPTAVFQQVLMDFSSLFGSLSPLTRLITPLSPQHQHAWIQNISKKIQIPLQKKLPNVPLMSEVTGTLKKEYERLDDNSLFDPSDMLASHHVNQKEIDLAEQVLTLAVVNEEKHSSLQEIPKNRSSISMPTIQNANPVIFNSNEKKMNRSLNRNVSFVGNSEKDSGSILHARKFEASPYKQPFVELPTLPTRIKAVIENSFVTAMPFEVKLSIPSGSEAKALSRSEVIPIPGAMPFEEELKASIRSGGEAKALPMSEAKPIPVAMPYAPHFPSSSVPFPKRKKDRKKEQEEEREQFSQSKEYFEEY